MDEHKKDPSKKSYVDDLKETFQGIFILLVLALIVWVVTELFFEDEHTSSYRKMPTQEDYRRWEKEFNEFGNNDPNIDISVQYGGR